MKKLALVALFAESTQPMFADNCAISSQVAVRTEISPLALTFGEECAHHGSGFYQER